MKSFICRSFINQLQSKIHGAVKFRLTYAFAYFLRKKENCLAALRHGWSSLFCSYCSYIFDGYLPFVEPIKIIYFPGTI